MRTLKESNNFMTLNWRKKQQQMKSLNKAIDARNDSSYKCVICDDYKTIRYDTFVHHINYKHKLKKSDYNIRYFKEIGEL